MAADDKIYWLGREDYAAQEKNPLLMVLLISAVLLGSLAVIVFLLFNAYPALLHGSLAVLAAAAVPIVLVTRRRQGTMLVFCAEMLWRESVRAGR